MCMYMYTYICNICIYIYHIYVYQYVCMYICICMCMYAIHADANADAERKERDWLGFTREKKRAGLGFLRRVRNMNGGGGSSSVSSAKTPADFLKSIRGRPVVVKLNSGVDYRGESFFFFLFSDTEGKNKNVFFLFFVFCLLGKTHEYVNLSWLLPCAENIDVDVKLNVLFCWCKAFADLNVSCVDQISSLTFTLMYKTSIAFYIMEWGMQW